MDVFLVLIWLVAIAWALMFFLGLGGLDLLRWLRRWGLCQAERLRQWWRQGRA